MNHPEIAGSNKSEHCQPARFAKNPFLFEEIDEVLQCGECRVLVLCPFILELIYSSCDERSQISLFLFCFLQFLQMKISRVGLIRHLRVYFVSVSSPTIIFVIQMTIIRIYFNFGHL